MRRWILAAAFLLACLVGVAQADYVIIVANLGLVKQKEDAQNQQMAGRGAGMIGGPGMNRLGGAGIAAGGGGPRAGIRGGAAGAGGQQAGGGEPGVGGVRPGAGAGAQPGVGGGGVIQPPAGVMGPGMGMMGGPGMMPGMGAQGGPPPGVMGPGMMPGMGAMGGPGMGAMGGPGMGAMGGPGMGAMGMMQGFGMFGAGAGAQTESTPFYVMTVVETKESISPRDMARLHNNKPIIIHHKWGTSTLQPELGLDIIVLKSGDKPFPSVSKRFQDRYKQAHKESEPSVEVLLDYNVDPQAGPARFALEHGLLKEFNDVMNEVAKIDPKHPKVRAWQTIDNAMKAKITKADAGDLWKQRLGLRSVSTSDHYVLLHNGLPDNEVKSRLNALENSYKAFFYWFAFHCDRDGNLVYVPKGKKDAPLVPDHRLVAVLTAKENEFDKDHKIFGNRPLVADGFVARRDNVAFFSSERLDKQYKALQEYCAPQFSVFGRDLLLKNKVSSNARGKTNEEFYVASTFALMMQSLEADSETATVSHEGPRQLLAAIGLLPRNVLAPEWIQFGMGSFFETSKGAPWGGAGGANWVYLQVYKDRSTKKKLDKPLEALLNVVTDRYFRQTNNGQDEAAVLKARTMAWSLTYFLAHRKLTMDGGYGLIRFYQELAKMPRDMEFDEDSLQVLFARAFNCLDEKGEKADRAKLTKLAEEWHRFIDQQPLEGEDVIKELRSRQSELKASNTAKPGEKSSATQEKK